MVSAIKLMKESHLYSIACKTQGAFSFFFIFILRFLAILPPVLSALRPLLERSVTSKLFLTLTFPFSSPFPLPEFSFPPVGSLLSGLSH